MLEEVFQDVAEKQDEITKYNRAKKNKIKTNEILRDQKRLKKISKIAFNYIDVTKKGKLEVDITDINNMLGIISTYFGIFLPSHIDVVALLQENKLANGFNHKDFFNWVELVFQVKNKNLSKAKSLFFIIF